VLRQLRHHPFAVWRQRDVPICLIAALAFGIIGLAQPVWHTQMAAPQSQLMLVMDISVSMEATDMRPTRLDAEKQAAVAFINDLPKEVEAGLVLFAGNTYLVSPPTQNHRPLVTYLKQLRKQDLRTGTAIGDAVLVAMDSLLKARQGASGGMVIVMTDGENNLGIAPRVAIEEARRQKVRLVTVGVGRSVGTYVRGGIFTRLDETMLTDMAEQTGGGYFRAKSGHDLKTIYRWIGRTLVMKDRAFPLMPGCMGLSMLFLILGLAWMIRYRRF
jgi:Ca-activated chloride channel family protein